MKNPFFRSATCIAIYATMYELPNLVVRLPDRYFWFCIFVSGAVPLVAIGKDVHRALPKRAPRGTVTASAPTPEARPKRRDEIPPHGEAPRSEPRDAPGNEPDRWEDLFA